jgi:hypothetical protein
MADKTVVMSGGPRSGKDANNNNVAFNANKNKKRQRSNPLAAAQGNAKRPSSCGIARRVPFALFVEYYTQQTG